PARLRRRRRVECRRLPPRLDGRVAASRPGYRRPGDGRTARAVAAASSSCRPVAGGHRAGAAPAQSGAAGDTEPARPLTAITAQAAWVHVAGRSIMRRELRMPEFTIPGLSEKDGNKVADLLQKQLSTYNDLHLTLKHVHWNVVGPNFIGVHEMIDPQVELVRGYADDVAERIAALGKSPQGTPGAIL